MPLLPWAIVAVCVIAHRIYERRMIRKVLHKHRAMIIQAYKDMPK